MSDISEGEYQYQLGLCESDEEDYDRSLNPLPRNAWRTADGRTLLLSEMTDLHLSNAIAFLRGRGGGEKIGDLELEQKRRGRG